LIRIGVSEPAASEDAESLRSILFEHCARWRGLRFGQ
jgi:hypothetical protein